MVTIEQVKNGLMKYIDTEILPHTNGAKRFAVGVFSALAAQNAETALMKYRENPAITMLGVVDENNNVDIDKIYSAAISAMPDRLSLDIPLVGVFTIGKADLDQMLDLIKGA